jgi:hypothetical protein
MQYFTYCFFESHCDDINISLLSHQICSNNMYDIILLALPTKARILCLDSL